MEVSRWPMLQCFEHLLVTLLLSKITLQSVSEVDGAIVANDHAGV